jgi:hypothetical protein
MNSSGPTVQLETEEYERRRVFCDSIKDLSKAEHIEIARILRRNGVVISENRSGMFFDMVKLSTDVFDELLQFRSFVNTNTEALKERENLLDGLKAESNE